MKKIFLSAILCVAVIMLAACGGTTEESAADNASESEQTPTVDTPTETEGSNVPSNPDDMAAKAFDMYAEGIEKVTTIVEGTDDGDAAQAEIADLREEMIQRYVEMGHVVASWEAAQVSAFQSSLRMKLSSIDMDLFQRYADAQSKFSDNVELNSLIKDFNIITQYSQFELLKKQEPEEAVRLGLQ